MTRVLNGVGLTELVGDGVKVGVGDGVGVATTDVGRTIVGVGSDARCLVSCCWLSCWIVRGRMRSARASAPTGISPE